MTRSRRLPSDAPCGARRGAPRGSHRRGSVLVLVLVMTLSLAGLAVSAVLLTSSSSLVQRYYDKEKDFRFHAQAAASLVKSVVQRDTTLTIPKDSAYRAITASRIADASGDTIADIRVNGYAAFTADTGGGTYIPFLTVMAQAYDTLGTRSVQRLDLWSEAFSRYAFFVDSFPATASIAVGQHIHGRVHSNRNWRSTTTSPGPNYYDTVTATGTVSGTASYSGISAISGAKRIKWPTTTTLASLGTLGTAGSLNFAPVSQNNWCLEASGGVDLSGRLTTSTACFTAYGDPWRGPATQGTRVRLRPVDVNNNGTYEASEGFLEVFDLAAGMDTGSIRADIPRTAPGSATNIVTMNQCGLMVTIPAGGGFTTAHKEFFPVARFREAWVRTRVQTSTSPTVSAADAAIMGGYDATADQPPSAAAVNKILSYGNGFSRCFPAGSPYLMLTERFVKDVAGVCTKTTSTSDTPYGWGGTTGACGVAQQYGGQDTTFTATVTRCFIYLTAGRCRNSQEDLGSWAAFGGTNTAAPPATVIQAVERPYLWPISTTYNAASRSVAYSSNTAPVFVSDTLRGYLTLYALGRIVLINDVVYDKDPLESGAECRNFLGLIAGTGLAISDNSLNRPRPDPGSTWRFLGSPNFTLHGIAMSLTNNVGVEAASGTAATSPALQCNGTNTSGGCINHTGGVITKVYTAVNIGAGTGFIENRSPDPCQQQQKNRRPPHFPLTGRYADYKAYEVDPRVSDTWAEVKTYLARLRGNNRAVP